MWYSSGTVTATNNSSVVTGVSTQFIANVRVGDGITIQGSSALHEVINISSNTQLTIKPNFMGATGGGKQFACAPLLGYDKDLSDAFNQLRLQFGDKLSSLQPWAYAATAAQARAGLGLGTAATTNNGFGFGQNIINSAVSGSGNISFSGTLLNITTGIDNTASGVVALRDNTSGSNNTATGAYVLLNNTTGGNNTAIGVSALQANTTGSNNTAIGRSALITNTGYDNCGGFGYGSQVTASNQIQLGDSATTVYAYGAVQNRSDARDKTEIRDTILGLDFINALRPVDYKLDMREDYRVDLGESPTKEQLESNKLANIQTDGTHTRKRYHHGVIAQQVAEAMEALGVDFGGFQDHSKIGGDDVLSIGYEEFIAPLIKAVQELSARVKELEDKVEREEVLNENK